MEKETLSPERVERWNKLMVPYAELSEKYKDYDRKWADMVLEIVQSSKRGDCATCENHDDYGCTWVHWVDPECKYVPIQSSPTNSEELDGRTDIR